MRRFATRLLLAGCLVMVGILPADGQTWMGGSNDWNTASNWNPATVPNSSSAVVSFTTTGTGGVNISSSVQVQSLSFSNTAGLYNMSSNSNQTMTGLSAINISSGNVTTDTINLAANTNGSMQFVGNLAITNNSNATITTLVLGPNMSFGTTGAGGLVFSGNGVSQISGSFASAAATQVKGGVSVIGPGKLIFSGNGNSLLGGLSLAGGTMELNYTANTASKRGGGGLTLSGGILSLVVATGINATQNVSGATINPGQTDVDANSNSAGSMTLNLGAITRNVAGGTIDVSIATGTPTLNVTTTTGSLNSLLGTGPAFATFAGATWATLSSGTISGLQSGNYGMDTYTSGTNVDVTTSAALAGFTANSLRFNSAAPTLTLSGMNTVQSGGILVTPSATGGVITSGTITGSGEIVVHQYSSSPFTINSAISSSGGLTKSGAGTLILGGTNTALTGPVNINRGNLTVTNAASIGSASQINFNDVRTAAPVQQLTVDQGDNSIGTISGAIRVLAPATNANGNIGTQFSTGVSLGERITLAGQITSGSSWNTPIRFTGSELGNSGFNLTNTANSFVGNISLFEGFLGITADSCLGNAANTLFLDAMNTTTGGLEFLGSGITVSRPIVINSSTRVVSNGNDVNTIAGTITSTAENRQLVKAGAGTLVLSGDGSAHVGGMTLNNGTLVLDYSANSALKMGGGALILNGGVLNLVANTATSVTQNVAGGTVVQQAQNDITATSAGGGSLTLNLGAISRSNPATMDVSTGSGSPTFAATTSTGNMNSLLGTGTAYATFGGGATWAMALGGTISGLSSYGSAFTTGTNVDVTNSASLSSFTANSLRFNSGGKTLTLSGIGTLQSGGILVTPNGIGSSMITGGTLTASNSGEIIVHQYNAAPLAINSALNTNVGLTKTGPGTLILGGNNTALTGPVNVNRGNLTVTAAAAITSASEIDFNDDSRAATALQQFTVDLGANGTISPSIRVSATSVGSFGTYFSTGNSANSRVTLSGLITSGTGLTTPIRFTGSSANSGFNLTNAGNSFTGNVSLFQGFLGISSDGALGNPANQLVLEVNDTANGGLEFINSGVSVARSVFFNAPTRVLSNGNDSNAIAGMISGAGTLVKAGTGTLAINNSTNNYSGGTTVSAGTLLVNNTSGSGTGTGTVGVSAAGTLGGTGTISGAVTNDGTVAPGANVGTLTLSGNYTQNAGGKLQIELASPSSFDRLVVSGAASINGTLQVLLTNGFSPGAGNSFDIMDWGALGGTFTTSVSLPILGPGLGWDTSQLYTAGVISVVNAPGLAGDFNGDGKVDAADYILWRKTDGTPSNYNTWRMNFGRTSGGEGGSVLAAGRALTAVPEPVTLKLLSWICLIAMNQRNQQAQRNARSSAAI